VVLWGPAKETIFLDAFNFMDHTIFILETPWYYLGYHLALRVKLTFHPTLLSHVDQGDAIN
jgi:hypothetical protein